MAFWNSNSVQGNLLTEDLIDFFPTWRVSFLILMPNKEELKDWKNILKFTAENSVYPECGNRYPGVWLGWATTNTLHFTSCVGQDSHYTVDVHLTEEYYNPNDYPSSPDMSDQSVFALVEPPCRQISQILENNPILNINIDSNTDESDCQYFFENGNLTEECDDESTMITRVISVVDFNLTEFSECSSNIITMETNNGICDLTHEPIIVNYEFTCTTDSESLISSTLVKSDTGSCSYELHLFFHCGELT